MSNKRQNRKLNTRLEKGLQNTEEARTIILEKLETYHNEDLDDEIQIHLLVNFKLELLDIKFKLKEMLEQVKLIK